MSRVIKSITAITVKLCTPNLLKKKDKGDVTLLYSKEKGIGNKTPNELASSRTNEGAANFTVIKLGDTAQI